MLLSQRTPKMYKSSNTIEVSSCTQSPKYIFVNSGQLSSKQGGRNPGSFHIVAPHLQHGASKVSVLLGMKPQKGKEWRWTPRTCFWTRPRSSPHGFYSPFTGQNLVTEPRLPARLLYAVQLSAWEEERLRTMGTELHIFLDLPLTSPTLGQLSDTPIFFYFLCFLGFPR